MKLFITLLLLTSVSSVLAHPKVKLHTHDGTVDHDIEFTNHSHTKSK
jgi:hypothetical protein